MSIAFVLGINMSVAGLVAAAFAVVAATNRTARGAWWLASGIGMGIVYVGLEFLLTIGRTARPSGQWGATARCTTTFCTSGSRS